jgi:hypothetical protein
MVKEAANEGGLASSTIKSTSSGHVLAVIKITGARDY